ncbi:MAG TPA: HEAT repeat domain-containing protein [Thermodesulfobacteriota bacterium]
MVRRHGRAAGALALAAIGTLMMPAGAARSANRGPGGSASDTASLWVQAARGRLSVALDEAPLPAVLDAIRAETGVAVSVHGSVAREVSDQFRGLTFERALRRLLRPFNVAFVYRPRRGGAPQLEKVVVYPAAEAERQPATTRPAAPPAEGPGRPVTAAEHGPAPSGPPLPPETEARLAALARLGPSAPAGAGAELDALIADPDPAVRQRALEVAEATQLASPDALRHAALADPDLQVRWAALAALVATAGREAAIAAAEGALSSPSPQERLAAVEALGEQLGGRAGEEAARRALADPDPAVRAKAAEIVAIIEEGEAVAADEEDDDEAEEPDDGADAGGRREGG